MKNNVQKKLTRKLWITKSRYLRNGARFRIRRNYKDRLFIQLFHDRKVLLELYNALNDTDYTDSEELIITTIGEAIYLGMKNDCSFIIGNYLNLYEHQSTFCPNMPIRGLFYIADIYQAYIAVMDLNMYGTRQIKLPTPKYVVFYNGEEEHEDVEYLHLSDAFEEEGSCLEFTATMYNINMGHNVLREFLLKNRNEVRRVLLTEYNAKHQRKLDRRDAREEEKERIILKMHDKGYLVEQIADITDKPMEEVRTIIENHNKS